MNAKGCGRGQNRQRQLGDHRERGGDGAGRRGIPRGETESENPLIRDPFARVFLDAAGDGVWNWYSAPQLPAELLEIEPNLAQQMQAMVGYMASRTAFFDAFFIDATTAGIAQVVILAAGLDAQSCRGRTASRSTSSTSPRCWISKHRRWPNTGPNPPATGSPSRWTYARTGQKRC